MDVYRVDDGTSHWVIAESPEDAVAVWHEEMVRAGVSDNELAMEEPPTARRLTPEEARATPVWEDGPQNVVDTMWGEYEKNPERRYVGGSE